MSHANATLTPRTRLRLARLIVDDGWTYSAAAKMFMVSPRTAAKWADRYRGEGPAGMADRSSRPHSSPHRTPPEKVRAIIKLRWRQRLGPVQISSRTGVPASTVHAVLVRCRVNCISRIDRVTGEPLRRYEHDHPGSLIHVDVTKFGNIPDGGGHRFLSRRTQQRPARLAPLLQSPPRPLSHRRPTTSQQTEQPPWTSQLAETDLDPRAYRAGVLPGWGTVEIAVTCAKDDLSAETVEPMTGIEPALSAWEADVLPLNYIGTAGIRDAPNLAQHTLANRAGHLPRPAEPAAGHGPIA